MYVLPYCRACLNFIMIGISMFKFACTSLFKLDNILLQIWGFFLTKYALFKLLYLHWWLLVYLWKIILCATICKKKSTNSIKYAQKVKPETINKKADTE